MRSSTAFLSIAILAGSAAAQTANRHPLGLDISSTSLTVPVMVNTAGQYGAFFKTRAAVMNPTSSAFTVYVTLYDGSGTAHQATIDLAAGQIKSYENFLEAVLSYTGAGTVKLETRGGPDQQFVVNSEVWTVGPGGRYGTSVPSIPYSGSGAQAFSAGIWVDSSARTNVACFNDSASANHILADIFDASGARLGTVTLDLAAKAWGQGSVPNQVSGGYVVFNSSGPSACYAVVVNNTSNDGHFIAAAEYLP
jgi:hypothetical protein